MTLEEFRKLRAEAQKRGEEAARKWHSNAGVVKAARNASQALTSKLRDQDKDV